MEKAHKAQAQVREVLEDLSIKHHPVSGIFTLPASPEEWNRYRLNVEQVEFYEQNGYLAGVRMLDDEQIQILRDELNVLTNPLHPGRHLLYEYHHPLMVHGSYENSTDWPRRAAVINVFRDGVLSASDQPPLAGVPAISMGNKMEGQFFPLLFDPNL